MTQRGKVLWAAIIVLAGQVWQGALAQEAGAEAAAGAELWAISCRRCHGMRDPQELRDDQWRVSMTHMRVRAGLTGEDTRNILRFLQASNQPTPERPAVRLAQASSEARVRVAQAPAADAATGEAVYRRTCVACHGADGRGGLPGVADLAAPGGSLTRSDEELLVSIRDGYQSPRSALAMPAKGGNPALTEDDVRAVIAYMRASFGAGR